MSAVPHGSAARTAVLDALILQVGRETEWYATRVAPRLRPLANGCVVWTGPTSDGGYGRAALPRPHAGRRAFVHRVAWLLAVGPLPYGHVLDHDGPSGCHNRLCCNVEHLAVATARHNTVATGRGVAALNAVKTHCPQGHALVPGNLILGELHRGYRACLTCRRERDRVRWAKVAAHIRATGLTQPDYFAQHGYRNLVPVEDQP